MKEKSPDQRKPARWPKPALLVLVGLIVVALPATTDLRQWAGRSLEWIDSLGIWGPAMFALIYVAACILLIPGSVLTLGAGALFGVLQGTLIVSLASTAGACASFAIGRFLARGWVRERMKGSARFEAIDRAVAGEGWRIVGLTRLSPVIPFSILNYAFGITGVRFRDYLIASWIGMLPGTVLYVYVGSLFENILDVGTDTGRSPTTAEQVFYWAGLVASIAVVVYITRVAKRALAARLGDS